MTNSDARGLPLLAALMVLVGLPAVGEATPPPVKVALEVIGEGRSSTTEQNWSMTMVDDGITTLCGRRHTDEDGNIEGWEFLNGARVEIDADADAPWGLVWAVLWASAPHMLLETGMFDLDTAGVETIDDQLVYCWGDEQRLCVDEELRQIVVLERYVDDTHWGIRVTRGGERLQLTEDGSPIARLHTGAQGCE